MEVPQTREQTLEVLRDFINPNTTSLEEITNEYCKILEQFENDIFIDRDEDIDVMDIGTGNKEEEEPTTSEINKIFRSTQDEIAQALKNDETFDPEVEGLLEQVRTRKRNEYHEANPGTVPKTEEERAEKVKVPPTSTALRAGRPPFWIPAPLDPDFGPAFNILPLDVAATVLYHFIRKRWEFNRVRANGQTWYQLIRILRAADVHAAWKRINRTLRMTLAITSPMARLELWAGSNKNYLDARGVASPNQGLLHARSILYLTQLCRILMNPVQVSVACPFCGVNNPDPFNHRHSELMIIVKLFLQRQYRYVEPIVLWDARTPEAKDVFSTFKNWVYRWKSEVVRQQPRPASNMITKTIGIAQAARANAVTRVLRRWNTYITATPDVLRNDKNAIDALWATFRSSTDVYMGFPIAGPSRRGRTVSYRQIDLWPGEEALDRMIDDQLVELEGNVPSTAANQGNTGTRSRRLQLPYEGLRTKRLPAAELPPVNATWGHAYTTEEEWHHFYSNYPPDPSIGSGLAGQMM